MKSNFQKMMENFAKSGSFSPEDVNVGGTLRPEETDRYIDLLVSQNDFLSKITVERSGKLTKDINVWEFIQEVIQRVPELTEPSEYTNFKNVGKKYYNLPGSLFAAIPFSFFEDNQRKRNLEGVIQNMLAKAYSRDILRLGFVGVSDTNDAGFKSLNKGWIQIAKDSAKSKKVDISAFAGTGGVIDWKELLSAVVAELPEIYKGEGATIIMNKADNEEYSKQIGGTLGGISYFLAGNVNKALSYNIETNINMPRGHVMFTPLFNLCFCHGTEVSRYRELKATRRGIYYTIHSHWDYELAVDEAAVLACDAA